MKDNSGTIHNYAAAFIDLLGQKDSLEGCGIIPIDRDGEEFVLFEKMVHDSVLAIKVLHDDFLGYYKKYSFFDESKLEQLPLENRDTYLEMQKQNLKFQRFSDGLVVYMSVGERSIKVPLNGIFGLLGTCGTLCFLGLARKYPIRGGLDIAWGAELNDNELYGCVIAKAHELENKIAQYPRVVVGSEFVRYLHLMSELDVTDDFSSVNKKLAERCYKMLSMDDDGYYIVDYLGKNYIENTGIDPDERMFRMAYDFVENQLNHWREKKNSKLAFRYSHLKSYFDKNKQYWIKN